MGISYKKLWHLLLDKDMIKKDLREACGLSTASVAKLSKGQNINTDVLVRICRTFSCDISDICEIVPDEEEGEKSQCG
jgi:DNA-binding Xre family transcriptional regulator